MGSINTTSTQQYIEQIADRMEHAELYFGHGTDNAWDEACWLVETVLRRGGASDIDPDAVLTSSQVDVLDALVVERIASRKPLAYLLQEAWFCGLPFFVDERVLVPRSPIAELIHNGFDPLLRNPPRRVLDLCAGGGCIGIACALAFEEAEVVLADISPQALEVARINVERYGLQDRVHLVQSDLFASVSGTFDLIVTNPPYVAQSELDILPDEFKREPALGLVSSGEGLDIPHRILRDAAARLNEDGLLVLETGATWEQLAESRPAVPFLWLEFDNGGEGVCALTRAQLERAAADGAL